MSWMKEAKQEEAYLKELRHHLHCHPELSGQEIQTVAYIRQHLEQDGISCVEVEDGGVLGFIYGRQSGKTLLMRADCDALPIEESPCRGGRPRPCISQNPGVMHACGHDLHTASLLTAARMLYRHREEFAGTIVLFFERSEEKGGPYQENLLRYLDEHRIHIDGGWAMHVSNKKSGTAYFMPGTTGAGVLPFSFTIQGKGGHGSRPYNAVSPIACFQSVAAAIDRLRMNCLSPYEPVTLSICMVQAGNACNVIPEELTFGGNGRFFSRDTGLKLREVLKQTVQETVRACGCQLSDIQIGEPGNPNYTDPLCCRIAKKMFDQEFGPSFYDDETVPPSMGSESFANIAARWPSIMFGFGVCDPEKGITSGIHLPEFDIDEDTMYLAPAYAAAYAVYYLNDQE